MFSFDFILILLYDGKSRAIQARNQFGRKEEEEEEEKICGCRKRENEKTQTHFRYAVRKSDTPIHRYISLTPAGLR